MANAKPLIYVEFILDLLRNGCGTYTEAEAVFLAKFKVTTPTFAKYWNKANETYIAEVRRVNNAKLDYYIELELKDVKRRFLSKDKKREILNDIAEGMAKVVKIYSTAQGLTPVEVTPDFKEIIKAIEVDNQMSGDNSAIDIREVSTFKPRHEWRNDDTE